MTKHLALVVAYELPDDADTTMFEAALRTMAAKIHELTPEPPARITAFTDVSAEVIEQAARAGALLGQAARLQLQPGDIIKITLPPDAHEDEVAQALDLVPRMFPEHQVVVLAHGATLETGPETAT